VWLATGYADMRKGFDGALRCEFRKVLKHDPHGGQVLRLSRQARGLIKLIWHDGQGPVPVREALERGRFIWPSTTRDAVTIIAGATRLSSGRIDWRRRNIRFRPRFAG